MEYETESLDEAWVLEQFAETNPDVLFMFSADWQELRFCDDAYEDIWGRSVSSLAEDSTSFLERVHPDDRERVEKRMQTLTEGEPIENEFRVLPAGGDGTEVRHVWSESKPVFDGETGEFVAIAGFVRDITERKVYEQELERANERLEGFAQFLSHDIRNQLSVAKGNVALAEAELGGSEYLETVTRALDRMEELTKDVLALASLDEESLETADVVLAELAEACWESEHIEAGELIIEDNAAIRVSPRQFRPVFENLFRNAIEHTGKEPTVRVGILSNESGLYVEDDGGGIDPEEAEEIFEFGHTSGGTGLGLTLVREVVRTHGGDISVTESACGGARFEISLPEPDVIDDVGDAMGTESCP